MAIVQFEDIQTDFMNRAQQAVYCNVATVDLKGRPRSRVMHVVWDGPIGWVITWPESHKAKHLANNPHVSLAYVNNPKKPVYVECTAKWVKEVDEMQRIWELHKTIPPPLGFDPAPHYAQAEPSRRLSPHSSFQRQIECGEQTQTVGWLVVETNGNQL